MKIHSSAFRDGGMIPGKYSCQGLDISPPLIWEDIPEKTKSLALVCEDPDAPVGNWVHWVYYDIPASVKSLPENVEKSITPFSGGEQGVNDFRTVGYGGPCPPGGTHRYFFKLYALDNEPHVPRNATKQQLEKEMKGHILDQAVLMGKFRR